MPDDDTIYTRKLSRDESKTSAVLILKSAWKRFPEPGTPMTIDCAGQAVKTAIDWSCATACRRRTSTTTCRCRSSRARGGCRRGRVWSFTTSAPGATASMCHSVGFMYFP